jgi:RNA polymerase sigma-70 factor (ECF subfamily)
VTRFQGGDQEAFSEIYIRYFDRIYAYLRVLLREDPHEAEDLAQQVFTKTFQALPRYERRKQPFRAWMFVIARNEGLLQLGRRNRVELTDPVELGRRREGPVDEAQDLSALNWISDRELVMFVDRLPILQRQVLVMRFMLTLTVGETAEALDLTASYVRQLESRALRFLEARLKAVGRAPRGERRPLQGRTKVSWLPVLRARRFTLVR